MKKKSWRRKYKQGRSRANNAAVKQTLKALVSGRGVEEDKDGDGFVYVMALGFDGLYKIGCTRDVSSRLKALRAANPKLTLVFAKRVSSRVGSERALHARYSDVRTEGELFHLDDEHLRELDAFFSGTEIDPKRLRVDREPTHSGRVCVSCGCLFEPEKSYWRMCNPCMKKSKNRTSSGWGRWRNLRTETHLYEERPGILDKKPERV